MITKDIKNLLNIIRELFPIFINQRGSLFIFIFFTLMMLSCKIPRVELDKIEGCISYYEMYYKSSIRPVSFEEYVNRNHLHCRDVTFEPRFTLIFNGEGVFYKYQFLSVFQDTFFLKKSYVEDYLPKNYMTRNRAVTKYFRNDTLVEEYIDQKIIDFFEPRNINKKLQNFMFDTIPNDVMKNVELENPKFSLIALNKIKGKFHTKIIYNEHEIKLLNNVFNSVILPEMNKITEIKEYDLIVVPFGTTSNLYHDFYINDNNFHKMIPNLEELNLKIKNFLDSDESSIEIDLIFDEVPDYYDKNKKKRKKIKTK